ncbi:MAG: hypothetical protein ACRBK7_03170 [Acidimicrobiales bacterium]
MSKSRGSVVVPGVLLALLLALFGVSCGSTAEDEQGSADSAGSAEANTETESETATGSDAATESDSSASERDSDSDAEPGDDSGDSDELFPDVIGVEATQTDDGSWTFSVTLSSPYDTPERYADAWRVAGLDGEVFGVRELTHDHQSEQPFTRSQEGIVIPDEVQAVVVEGRDQLSGWGGDTINFELQR